MNMERETRHGVKVLLGLLHIALQLVWIYLIVALINTREAADVMEELRVIRSLITHVSLMFGTFYIYYALNRLMGIQSRQHN